MKLKSKPVYVIEAEKAYDAAVLRWAKELELKTVKVKDTYGQLPGALAFVTGETPSKLDIIRPVTGMGLDVPEESWHIQKASVTDESLKSAGIKYNH